MLVECDEFAEGFRCYPFGEDRIRRAVALEDPVRHEPIGRTLSFDLFSRLTEGQRFALSEDVRHEHIVVLAERVEGLVERDEVAWNESRSLMNQLVERVLAVCARLTPVDRPGIIRDFVAVNGDVLAIALHRQLLQIGWK